MPWLDQPQLPPLAPHQRHEWSFNDHPTCPDARAGYSSLRRRRRCRREANGISHADAGTPSRPCLAARDRDEPAGADAASAPSGPQAAPIAGATEPAGAVEIPGICPTADGPRRRGVRQVWSGSEWVSVACADPTSEAESCTRPVVIPYEKMRPPIEQLPRMSTIAPTAPKGRFASRGARTARPSPSPPHSTTRTPAGRERPARSPCCKSGRDTTPTRSTKRPPTTWAT